MDDGVITAEEPLRLGRELRSEVMVQGRGSAASFARVLTAAGRAEDGGRASAIANTWAEVFIQQSQILGPGASPAAETLLDEHLAPTRDRIQVLEADRRASLAEHDKRREKLKSSWDAKIQAYRAKINEELAEYRAGTRAKMEEVVRAETDWFGGEEEVSEETRSLRRVVLQLIGARSQLAQFPHLVAPSSELRAGGQGLSPFDELGGESLEDQVPVADSRGVMELHSVQELLTLTALDLEGRLEERAGGALSAVARVIAGIESVQYQRQGGVSSLMQRQEARLNELHRRASQELAALTRERDADEAAFQRRLDQLTKLEEKLADKHNTSVVEQVLGEMETVRLAAAAVPPELPDERRLPLKVALAMVLGSLLGLVVALFR